MDYCTVDLASGKLLESGSAVLRDDLLDVLTVGITEAIHRHRGRLASLFQQANLAVEDGDQAALDLEGARVVDPSSHWQLAFSGNLKGVAKRIIFSRSGLGLVGRLRSFGCWCSFHTIGRLGLGSRGGRFAE